MIDKVFGVIPFFLPEIGLVLISFFLLLLSAFCREKNTYVAFVQRYLPWGLILILFVFCLPLIGVAQGTSFGLAVKKDALTIFASIFLLVLFIFFSSFSPKVLLTANIRSDTFYALNIFALLGMVVTMSANSCLTMFVGLELQALSFYPLICLRRTMSSAVEGAVKYYALGAFASGLLLLGCAFFYGATGELSFHVPLTSNPDSPFSALFILSLFFIFVALFFKFAAAPFHFWSPDVYQGTSNAQLTFLAIGPKITIVVLMMRLIMGPFSFLIKIWQPILKGVIVSSLVIGTLSALHQTNIRRLLAYSAISHVGFLLMALLSGGVDLTPLLIYVIAYALSLFGFLYILSHLHNADFEISDIDDLKGLSQDHPFLTLCLSTFLFSLAGIPPFAGFWGKFYVIIGVVEQEFFWLAIFAIMSSVVAAYYYLRLIKLMYFDSPAHQIKTHGGYRGALTFVILVVSFPILQVYLGPIFINIAKQLPLGL